MGDRLQSISTIHLTPENPLLYSWGSSDTSDVAKTPHMCAPDPGSLWQNLLHSPLSSGLLSDHRPPPPPLWFIFCSRSQSQALSLGHLFLFVCLFMGHVQGRHLPLCCHNTLVPHGHLALPLLPVTFPVGYHRAGTGGDPYVISCSWLKCDLWGQQEQPLRTR